MTEKTITLTTVTPDGKKTQVEVHLAYCFATEIAYHELSGEDINDYMQAAAISISSDTPRMPDVKKTIYAILAAAMAYSQATGKDIPIKDTDLMIHATPQELGSALGTIIGLRAQFYNVPVGEPEEKPKKGTRQRKNV